jgi:predicted peptidase
MLSALVVTLIVLQKSGTPMVDATTAYEELSIRYKAGDKEEQVKYRLLKPAKIEAGKKYPLVVFLHGAGERGDDNRAQLKFFPEMMAQPAYRETYECFVLAPQCRRDKKWVEVNWGDKLSVKQPDDPGDQMKAAMQMLEETIKREPIDTGRLYLTGLSMGGYGSWDWAMREPDRFAAVVPICGGGDESKAGRLAKTPVWSVHGDADNVVPVERTRRMIDAIKQAGGQPKYTELPGVGHNSWTPAYTDPKGVVPWMFEQKK